MPDERHDPPTDRHRPDKPVSGPSTRTITEMVTSHDLEKVTPSRRYELELLNLAGEKIAAAQQILQVSPSLALTGAYDAARHAVDAHMNANGVRARSGEGSHRVRVDYAHQAMTGLVSDDLLRDYAAARQIRHEAEYPSPNRPVTIRQPDAERTIELAKTLHSAVTNHLKKRSG